MSMATEFVSLSNEMANTYFPVIILETSEITLQRMTRKEFQSSILEIKENLFPFTSFVDFSYTDSGDYWDQRFKHFSERHAEFLIIKSIEQVIGWIEGEMYDAETFYLRSGGIIFQHRKKKIVDAVLKSTMQYLVNLGYMRIISDHLISNNNVLVFMLSNDFFISGFELDERFGFHIRTMFLKNSDRKRKLIKKFDYNIELSNPICIDNNTLKLYFKKGYLFLISLIKKNLLLKYLAQNSCDSIYIFVAVFDRYTLMKILTLNSKIESFELNNEFGIILSIKINTNAI